MKETQKIIRDVRNALKMSQLDFAFAIGVDERTVRRMESGKSEGKLSYAPLIIRLCKNNGIDLDAIVFCFKNIDRCVLFSLKLSIYNKNVTRERKSNLTLITK